MGYIDKWLKKPREEITSKDLVTFISKNEEENIHLDYKHIKKYDDFNGLAHDICSFANSDGGLIILGVSETRGVNNKIFPDVITWGDSSLNKERLENKLLSRIKPSINDLIIQPVRESNTSAKVVFLIDIPKSKLRPHMSIHSFYKRRNFRKQIMDYDEIKSMFLETQINRKDIVDKIISPLFGSINNIIDHIDDVYYEIDTSIFYETKSYHLYLLFQIQAFDIIELMENIYKSALKRNMYLNKSNNIIWMIIKKQSMFMLDRLGKSVGRDATLNINLLKYDIRQNIIKESVHLEDLLLRKIYDVMHLMKSSKDYTGEVEYIILTNGTQHILNRFEADELLREIIKETKENEELNYIWDSQSQIKQSCIDLKNKLLTL